jgi:hypothetical protein
MKEIFASRSLVEVKEERTGMETSIPSSMYDTVRAEEIHVFSISYR